MTMRTQLAAITALAATLLACSGQDTQNEARLVIERYDALIRGGEDGRAARVERLRELPVLDDEVRRVRDRCVDLHLAVLRAEGLLDQARTRVEALEDGGRVTSSEQREIESLLIRAEAAKQTADRGMHACSDGMSRLRAHHGRRH